MRPDTEESHAILKIVGIWRRVETCKLSHEHDSNALPLPNRCRLEDVTRHQIL